jgi:predicted TIM-barrel fold metal-dependent hydrolase
VISHTGLEETVVTAIIDSDQHLFESSNLWAEYIDPAHKDDALSIVEDDLGYSWLTWRDRRLDIADVQVPGDTGELGRRRQRRHQHKPPEYRYEEALPAHYWNPVDRARHLAVMGLDEAVVFPNFGLLWERRLSESLPALTSNMTAWNRWCACVVTDGGGLLHPVAHLTLRDPSWLANELAELSSRGVRLAMIAPAAVDGRPLSHPDHDSMWAAFVDHGVTPVFHVADQPRILDEAFYTDPDESFVPVIESIFLWVPPALAVTDLIVNGTLARFPALRIGIVELSSIWVPQYLMMLDGGWEFTSAINGRALTPLDMRPSEYFRRQVRVSSFSYEQPARLTAKAGDLFMCCSDFPHSEGTGTPIEDYGRVGSEPQKATGLFHDNVAALLTP